MGLKINLPSAGLLGISGAKDFSWTSVYDEFPTPRTLSENSIFAFGGEASFTVNLPADTISDGATIVMKNITAKDVETFTVIADPSAMGGTQTFTLSKEPVGAVDFSEIEGVTITNIGTQVSAVYTAPIDDPVEFTATYSAVVVTISPASIDGEMMSLPVIPGETVELYWIGSHNNEDGTKGTWIHTDISSTLGSGDTITQESADARYLRQGAGVTLTTGDARYVQLAKPAGLATDGTFPDTAEDETAQYALTVTDIEGEETISWTEVSGAINPTVGTIPLASYVDGDQTMGDADNFVDSPITATPEVVGPTVTATTDGLTLFNGVTVELFVSVANSVLLGAVPVGYPTGEVTTVTPLSNIVVTFPNASDANTFWSAIDGETSVDFQNPGTDSSTTVTGDLTVTGDFNQTENLSTNAIPAWDGDSLEDSLVRQELQTVTTSTHTDWDIGSGPNGSLPADRIYVTGIEGYGADNLVMSIGDTVVLSDPQTVTGVAAGTYTVESIFGSGAFAGYVLNVDATTTGVDPGQGIGSLTATVRTGSETVSVSGNLSISGDFNQTENLSDNSIPVWDGDSLENSILAQVGALNTDSITFAEFTVVDSLVNPGAATVTTANSGEVFLGSFQRTDASIRTGAIPASISNNNLIFHNQTERDSISPATPGDIVLIFTDRDNYHVAVVETAGTVGDAYFQYDGGTRSTPDATVAGNYPAVGSTVMIARIGVSNENQEFVVQDVNSLEVGGDTAVDGNLTVTGETTLDTGLTGYLTGTNGLVGIGALTDVGSTVTANEGVTQTTVVVNRLNWQATYSGNYQVYWTATGGTTLASRQTNFAGSTTSWAQGAVTNDLVFRDDRTARATTNYPFSDGNGLNGPLTTGGVLTTPLEMVLFVDEDNYMGFQIDEVIVAEADVNSTGMILRVSNIIEVGTPPGTNGIAWATGTRTPIVPGHVQCDTGLNVNGDINDILSFGTTAALPSITIDGGIPPNFLAFGDFLSYTDSTRVIRIGNPSDGIAGTTFDLTGYAGSTVTFDSAGTSDYSGLVAGTYTIATADDSEFTIVFNLSRADSILQVPNSGTGSFSGVAEGGTAIIAGPLTIGSTALTEAQLQLLLGLI